MNTLLEDIAFDHHQDLLVNGNLKKPKVEWTGENQWHDAGYSAVLEVVRCACGASTENLLGLFHTERTPSGTSRAQRLDDSKYLQFPPGHKSPITCSERQVRICPSCLTSKGFNHV